MDTMPTRMRASYFRRSAALLVFAALTRSAPLHELSAQGSATSTFVVFLRVTPIGNEQVSVERSNGGWTISGSGRVGPPTNLVLRSFEMRYDADWKPLRLRLDATLAGRSSVVETTVADGTARNEITPLGGTAVSQAHRIDPQALFLPNPFVAPWEAFA